MAKKSKKVSLKSPTANTEPMLSGLAMPSAKTQGAYTYQISAKYAPNEQLSAKMPTEMDSIKSKLDEEELIHNTPKKAPVVPKKKVVKKVAPKKAAPKKEAPKKKKGKIIYIKSKDNGSSGSYDPKAKKVTSSDAVKY